MKLRRAQNAPHHGLGEFGKARRKPGIKAGAHLAQRDHSGYDDRHGYREGARISPRDEAHRTAGHPGIGQERRLNAEVRGKAASERRDGYHTGKPSKGDTNVRRGAEGNGKGSPPPGVGKGSGVRGTPESHRVGQGGTGRIGKHDGYKGKPTSLPEDLGHGWFEKLGAG